MRFEFSKSHHVPAIHMSIFKLPDTLLHECYIMRKCLIRPPIAFIREVSLQRGANRVHP